MLITLKKTRLNQSTMRVFDFTVTTTIIFVLFLTLLKNSAFGCLMLRCEVAATTNRISCCFDYKVIPSLHTCRFEQINTTAAPEPTYDETHETFLSKPVGCPSNKENLTCFENLYEIISRLQDFTVELVNQTEVNPRMEVLINRQCCSNPKNNKNVGFPKPKSCIDYTTTTNATATTTTTSTTTATATTTATSTTTATATATETTTTTATSTTAEKLFTSTKSSQIAKTSKPTTFSDSHLHISSPPSNAAGNDNYSLSMVQEFIKSLSTEGVNESETSAISDESLYPAAAKYLDRADKSLDRIAQLVINDAEIKVGKFELVMFGQNLKNGTIDKIKHRRLSKTKLKMVQVQDRISKINVAIVQFPAPKVPQNRKVYKKKDKHSQLVVSKYQPADAHLLGITVYNQDNNLSIQASISFTKSVKNDTTPAEIVAASQKTSTFYKTVFMNADYVCEYYNDETKTYSSYGCQSNMSKTKEVTCYCNHTTIFAVLLAVDSYKVPETVTVLSYIFESISVLSLVFTLIVLAKVKKLLRNDRTIVQINLSLALMLFHIINLFYDLALKNEKTCEMIAVLIHYFLLATASWMFVEGFSLFIKTTDQSLTLATTNSKEIMKKKLFLAWGIPAFIVCLATVIGFSTGTYMAPKVELLNQYNKCWVSSKSGMLIGAVVVPVAIVYILNVLIAVKVLYFVFNMSRNTEKFKPTYQPKKNDKHLVDTAHINAALKGFILLFPLLGIGWLFSFFSGLPSYQVSLVFMYLNVIFNGLQGFFLMLVYCVFGSEVRKVWVRKVNQKISSIELFESKSAISASQTEIMSSSQTSTRSVTALK